jgi:hypothetical protein
VVKHLFFPLGMRASSEIGRRVRHGHRVGVQTCCRRIRPRPAETGRDPRAPAQFLTPRFNAGEDGRASEGRTVSTAIFAERVAPHE